MKQRSYLLSGLALVGPASYLAVQLGYREPHEAFPLGAAQTVALSTSTAPSGSTASQSANVAILPNMMADAPVVAVFSGWPEYADRAPVNPVPARAV